ncbi:MAG: hypothetical protein DWQ44_13050 [Bacteroidetes bacterium]|nr:MAG: hypothetical protein DWQ33_13435 [Bacteroidota bacterium]REK05803.1 MAG: hypothetical protein DWQ39_05200 [Bacteroidota bacterium]REK31893.1 MAG: hypothetical protein DWQ44_13050 [Bacteroidota bacterium]REK49958.1 MAG: hypothetical protein DWQ48_05270 [Bacteroidota bacterium]
MKYLIELVKTDAGLTDEQATKAVESMMKHFKSRFPEFLHSELDKIADGSDFGDSFRDKFEAFRDKLSYAAKQTGEKAEGLAEEIKIRFNEFLDSLKKK